MKKQGMLLGIFLTVLWGAHVAAATDTILTKEQDYEKKKIELQAINVPLDKIKYDAAPYRGQILEVKGKITGIVVSTRSRTFILETDKNGSIFIINAPENPLLQNGSHVKVLGRVPQNAVTLSELEFVIVMKRGVESSEPIVPETANALVLKTATPTRQPQSLPSRGGSPMSAGSAPVPANNNSNPKPPATSFNPSSGNWMEQRIAEQKPQYKRTIAGFNKRLSEEQLDAIADAILRYSVAQGVDPRLMVAIIAVESDFNPNCTSHKGAMGLGQLMPVNVKEMGVKNPYDPVENIAVTCRLIRGHLDDYRDKSDGFNLALAAYNAGPGAVRRYGGIPPYKETTRYIVKVNNLYKQLAPDMYQ